MAADLFVVPTVTFRLLFVLVILGHDRRRIVHIAVTEHPTAAGPRSSSATRFRNATRPNISCTIAMRSLPTWRPRSPPCTFRRFAPPRDHRGRMTWPGKLRTS
jgi:hypothetical protein